MNTFLVGMPTMRYEVTELCLKRIRLSLNISNVPIGLIARVGSANSKYTASLFTSSYLDDIFSNLHGKVGKTQVVKSLTNLTSSNEITCKTYGKQAVYVTKQVRIKPVAMSLY